MKERALIVFVGSLIVVEASLLSHSVNSGGGHVKVSKKSYVARIIEEELALQDLSSTTERYEDDPAMLTLPRSEDEENAPRTAHKRENWYVYDGKGRSMGDIGDGSGGQSPVGGGNGPDSGGKGGKGGPGSGGRPGTGGGGDGSGPGGSGGDGGDGSDGGGGGGGGGGKLGKKKPYNVVRAKPRDVVDPSGYNFFQFQPHSKIGFLWISGNKSSSGRGDLGGDDGDEDDLDPANKYDWEFRRYDRACLYVEYKQAKADVKIPKISLETQRMVDAQNKYLARKFLNWTFDGPEHSNGTEADGNSTISSSKITDLFLNKTKQLFMTKICKNASSYAFASLTSAPSYAHSSIVANGPQGGNATGGRGFLPEAFVDHLYSLFMVLRDITRPKNIPEYPSELDKTIILDGILKNCSDSEEDINWFTHSCGDQVLSNDQANNYACTPMHDYDFNTKLYDPILDTVWHMFNAVHSYCFSHFQKNPRMWHRYALIMSNAFTQQMRQRWKASIGSSKFYMRLLGPEADVYMETINRCMYGTTLRTDTPMLLPRFDTPSQITFAPLGTMIMEEAARNETAKN